jgi:acetylornithine deacetylase/succinyl-diaminopimelate desuccinylase-like protein
MCRVNHPRWHGIAAAALFAAAVGLAHAAKPVGADPPTRQLAHDIFKELIEINTTDSVGSTDVAAAAMAKRLRDAGFAPDDISLLGPSDRKGNLVVRYRGKAGTSLRPVLIIGHLDVVEARREDWSTDPFQFVEKDGYYYGRGTQDMKISDAIAVVDFIRLRKEGYVPDRDIILALTADEEGGEVYTDAGKPISIEIQAAEKLYADFEVLATDRGGHSGLPTPDNPIYRVSHALRALENAPFPFELNAVTRAYYAQMEHTESAPRADLMQAKMPNYGVCGVAIDRNDIRWHGRDERVLVSSFYDGLEFYYELLRALTGGKH